MPGTLPVPLETLPAAAGVRAAPCHRSMDAPDNSWEQRTDVSSLQMGLDGLSGSEKPRSCPAHRWELVGEGRVPAQAHQAARPRLLYESSDLNARQRMTWPHGFGKEF